MYKLVFKICHFNFQKEWKEAMKEDDAIKTTYITTEIHSEFIKGYRSGNVSYDILVK